jgi:hypothetical protein
MSQKYCRPDDVSADANMCRFNSGFFFEQEVLEKYKWYWRVEPGVEVSSPFHLPGSRREQTDSCRANLISATHKEERVVVDVAKCSRSTSGTGG